jgi:hypothetical protein
MKLPHLICAASLASCAPAPDPLIPASPVERQMVGLLEKFDRWDLDGNGLLTASELDEAEQISGVTSKEILAFYDTNKDGGISLREAQNALARTDEAEIRAAR